MHARIALAALLALGASAWRAADETPSPTPAAPAVSTGVVDVGGYGLDRMCEGDGSPTIVAEAGYDSAGTSTLVRAPRPLSEISRVCTYDRAGDPSGGRERALGRAAPLVRSAGREHRPHLPVSRRDPHT